MWIIIPRPWFLIKRLNYEIFEPRETGQLHWREQSKLEILEEFKIHTRILNYFSKRLCVYIACKEINSNLPRRIIATILLQMFYKLLSINLTLGECRKHITSLAHHFQWKLRLFWHIWTEYRSKINREYFMHLFGQKRPTLCDIFKE